MSTDAASHPALPPDAQQPCELCALSIGNYPLALHTATGALYFCCEGCRGIYALLHNLDPNTPSSL